MTALAFHEKLFIKNTNVFYDAINRFFAYDTDSIDACARIEDEEFDAVCSRCEVLTEFMQMVIAQHYAVEILEIEYRDGAENYCKKHFVRLTELTEPCYGFASPSTENALREAIYRFDKRSEAIAFISEFNDYVDSACAKQEQD